MTDSFTISNISAAFHETAWKWVVGLGGPGLILLGILDNLPLMSAPPGSIDILVIMLAAGHHAWWAYYAFMAAIGEVTGGYLTYRLAMVGGQAMLEKEKVGKGHIKNIYNSFERHQSATLVVGSLLPPPFPFTPVIIVAGLLQFPPSKFLAALTAGRLLRFLIAAVLGRIYGRQIIEVITTHHRFILLVLAVVATAGIVAYFAWYRPKSQREKQSHHSQTSGLDSHAGS